MHPESVDKLRGVLMKSVQLLRNDIDHYMPEGAHKNKAIDLLKECRMHVDASLDEITEVEKLESAKQEVPPFRISYPLITEDENKET